jgi:Pvc16 N-terminal domain/IPT/TIG domain
MSSALALAGVSAVLTDLLNNGLVDNDIAPLTGPVNVSAKPPDRVTPSGGTDLNQLNLFLYHVAPNPGWRNRALPSRDGEGARLTNPPLALDLFYLLTAYGAKDFQAEILLGYAMQLFHETPVLTRDAIRTALGGSSNPPVTGGILPDDFKALVAADLADQVEQIKIIPQAMSTEEMSKLWTALQTSYRPTAAYQVSVVLIESRRPTRPTLPVRERKLFVMPFRQPTIDAAAPQIVLAGDTLTLAGRNLKGEISKVRFGSVTVDPDPDTLSDSQLEVTVPTALLAGVNTVQVVHSLDFGTSQEPHRGFASNVAAFMIAPKITSLPASVAVKSTLTLSVTPPVGRNQRVALLLGDRTIFIPDRPPTDPAESANLNFPIPADFPTGTSLLRVQVDGAESSLSVDPVTGEFNGPVLSVVSSP